MRFMPGCECCDCACGAGPISNCLGAGNPCASCVGIVACCDELDGTFTAADQGGDEWLVASVGSCCAGASDSWFLSWDSGSSLWELMYCSSAYAIYRGTFDSSRVAKTLTRFTACSRASCWNFRDEVTITPVGVNDWEFTT